jgi:hypothetical protein
MTVIAWIGTLFGAIYFVLGGYLLFAGASDRVALLEGRPPTDVPELPGMNFLPLKREIDLVSTATLMVLGVALQVQGGIALLAGLGALWRKPWALGLIFLFDLLAIGWGILWQVPLLVVPQILYGILASILLFSSRAEFSFPREQVRPPSGRRTMRFLVVPAVVVVVVGLVLGVELRPVWQLLSLPSSPSSPTNLFARPAPVYDAPPELVKIAVPHRLTSITWSADGAYLAAAAWGWRQLPSDEKPSPSEVYVLDVATASVVATFQVTGADPTVAFSPDGKWLAVATTEERSDWWPTPAQVDSVTFPAALVVFNVPERTTRLTARSHTRSGLSHGFRDLAWAQDSKALYAIDGEGAGAKEEVRRWTLPGLTEQAAIPAQQGDRFQTIAVSPDGRTLAAAVNADSGGRIRLFDLDEGKERQSFPGQWGSYALRLVFSADGSSIGTCEMAHTGKFYAARLSWWDSRTAQAANPGPVRIAVQPAGLGAVGLQGHHLAVSLDGRWRALGEKTHSGGSTGAFIRITTDEPEQTWNWHVGESGGHDPALAFSPDGTRLAATVQRPSRKRSDDLENWVLIWPVPK